MSSALTSCGEDNCEDQSDGAHNLALVRGGVDVILQGKHDRAKSDDISQSKLLINGDLPIKTWKNIRKKKKISVPDEEIKYGNMSRLIKSAASCQKYDSIKSKYLAKTEGFAFKLSPVL